MLLKNLRDYQVEALESVKEAFIKGKNRPLVVLPTGTGKTPIIVGIAEQYKKKTLILAHRDELISQAVEKIELFWPEADLGVCKAERNEIDRQVVVGSVQTCFQPKRLQQLKEKGFDVLIIDEAHHASANSYQQIIKELDFFDNPNKLLVGVTATPERNDNKGLGDVFQEVVFFRSISTMIQAGWLVPVIGRRITTNCSLHGIKTQMGDFVTNALADAVNIPERNKLIVKKYLAHAKNRQTVAFCVDVQHCKDLAECFKDKNVKASAVWGAMPSKDRKQILDDFKKGNIQVVTSCGVLTEGFDEPSIECVIHARPTKSQILYIQMTGRGLRPHPGKKNCLILDFVDSYHSINAIIDLSKTIPEAIIHNEGKKKTFTRKKISPQNKKQVKVNEIADEKFDVLTKNRFMWIAVGDKELSLVDDYKNEIIIRPFESGYIAMLYSTNGKTESIVQQPVDLEYCKSMCEDFVQKNLKATFADLTHPRTQSSRYKQPSPQQIEILRKNRCYDKKMSQFDACVKIRWLSAMHNKRKREHINDPITEAQKAYLKRYGVIDCDTMTKHSAMVTIQHLKSIEKTVDQVIRQGK